MAYAHQTRFYKTYLILAGPPRACLLISPIYQANQSTMGDPSNSLIKVQNVSDFIRDRFTICLPISDSAIIQPVPESNYPTPRQGINVIIPRIGSPFLPMVALGSTIFENLSSTLPNSLSLRRTWNTTWDPQPQNWTEPSPDLNRKIQTTSNQTVRLYPLQLFISVSSG